MKDSDTKAKVDRMLERAASYQNRRGRAPQNTAAAAHFGSQFSLDPDPNIDLQQDNDEQLEQNNVDNFSGGCLTLSGAASRTSTLTTTSSSPLWHAVVLDTGTNVHVVNSSMEQRIVHRRPATEADQVYSGNTILEAAEVVDAVAWLRRPDGSPLKLTLKDALYIPSFMANLVSLKRLNKIGLHLDSTKPLELFTVEKNEKRRIQAIMSESASGHWILERNSQNLGSGSNFVGRSIVASASRKADPRELTQPLAIWHKLLGHPSLKAIEMLPRSTIGMGFADKTPLSTVDCQDCLLSKAQAVVSRRSEKHCEVLAINLRKHLAVVSWDLIEMDESLDGKRFLSHFYYDNEAYHVVKAVHTKAEAVADFKYFFPLARSTLGAHTTILRTDLEGAISEGADNFLKKMGIQRLPSAANTQAQNGAAEVAGKTIVRTARTLRVASNLPKNLWPWLCLTAAYLLNRTPTKKLNWKTPFEATTGEMPSLAHLHIVGSRAFELILAIS